MGTELKSQDGPQQSSLSDWSVKSAEDVQEKDSECEQVAAGIQNLSLSQNGRQGQGDDDAGANTPCLGHQMDSEKAAETAATGRHSPREVVLSDRLPECTLGGNFEGNIESSLGLEAGGFPEMGSGYSLESYLSDFKPSGSSTWGQLDMSESCIDGLLGQLGSLEPGTQTQQKDKEEEDVLEDNRCPSTFIVSDREDSWPVLEDNRCPSTFCVSDRESLRPVVHGDEDTCPSTFFVSCRKDNHKMTGDTDTCTFKKTGFDESKQSQPAHTEEEAQTEKMQGTEVSCLQDHPPEGEMEPENTLGPQLEAKETSGREMENFAVALDSLGKDLYVTDQSSLGFSVGSGTAEKEGTSSLGLTAMPVQRVSDSSSQIISKEHEQALQLLGLIEGTADPKEEADNLRLDMLSLSEENLSSGQLKKKEDSSLQHRDERGIDTVSFVSDYLDGNTLLSTEMDPKPCVHDPDYIKDGYLFNIEENHPPVHSNGESDISLGSSDHATPPIPDSPMHSRDQQARMKEDIRSKQSHAESSPSTLIKSTSFTEHHAACPGFTESMAGSSSFTDFSFLGLPSRKAGGESRATQEDSPVPAVNPGEPNSPDESSTRPVPSLSTSTAGEAALNTPQVSISSSGSEQKLVSENQKGSSGNDWRGPAMNVILDETQNTGNVSGQLKHPPGSETDLSLAKTAFLEQMPSPRKKSRQSDEATEPVEGPFSSLQINVACSHMPAASSNCELDHTGAATSMAKEGGKQIFLDQGKRYPTDTELTQPCHGAKLPLSSHRTQHTPQKHCYIQGNQRAESHIPQSSARPAPQVPLSSGLCLSSQAPGFPREEPRSMDAATESRTVVVRGKSLDEEQGDLCRFYFENKKRSDGGDIQEEGVVWREEEGGFLITFVESHVAQRVASREHSLKNYPVEVQLWSPARRQSAFHSDRVLILGVPPKASCDLLLNYLEPTLDVDVVSVEVNDRDSSALVIFDSATSKIDLQQMEQACQNKPLDSGVRLSFQGVPVSGSQGPDSSKVGPDPSGGAPVCSTIQVTGLKPETVHDSVRVFFSNKRRNAGGPVKSVEKAPGSSTAIVHFEHAADAKSVVEKGNHVLEGHQLCVSLYQASDSRERPDQQNAACSPAAPSAVSSSPSFRELPEQAGSGSPYQQPSATHMMNNPQTLPSSFGETGFARSQFSSSASAQVEGREREPRGPTSSSSFRELPKEAGSGSPYQQPNATRLMNNPQMLPTSFGETGVARSQYSSSASAQVEGGEREPRGPKSYGHGFQHGPSHNQHSKSADMYTVTGPPDGRNAQPEANLPPAEEAYKEGAYREGVYRDPPMGSQRHAGPANSALIDSCSHQPKQKYDYDERSFLSGGQGNPQMFGNYAGVEQGSHTAPAPGFKPDVVREPPPHKTVRINLGADVIQKMINDCNLLRMLIESTRSLEGRFQWDRPDHIVITSRTGDPGWDWENKVAEEVNHITQCIRLQLQRERESLRQEEQMETDPPEPPASGSNNRTGMFNVPPASKTPYAGDMHQQPKQIPNLKPGQLKILRLPKTLEKLKRGHPGLEISVDEDKKTAVVRAPETDKMKAFSDVLTFVTNLRETRFPLTPALAQMYRKQDAQEWIQRTLIEKYDLLCHWEVCEDCITLSCQNSDIMRLEQMLKSAFKEAACTLNEKEVCLLKSPAWASFVEKMQEENRGGCPTPVLLHEGSQVTIVDTPSNLSTTRLSLRNFLDENKFEKEVLKIDPNHVRFLQQYCKEETKAAHKKAGDVGVTMNFTNDSMVAEGPKDSLAETVRQVRELVGRIKGDKMTFGKPGVASYLTGPKGQEFLVQTGTATQCYITTNTSNGAGGDGMESGPNEGHLLAKVNLDSNHQVLIVQGDITKCAVDAIVNAANTELSHGGGVALAIAKAGGPSIQDESDDIVAQGNLREGEVAVTGAGSLLCSHILHAVGPTWQGGYQDERELLIRTVKNTLKKAESMQLTSVAMPAISCGIFRYPVDEATDTIIRAIGQYFREATARSCLRKLILIDVGGEPLQGFLKASKMLFGKLMEVKGEPKYSSRPGRQGSSQASEYRPHRDSNSDHGYGSKSHAPIKIIAGEIAKSRADVIVCATHPSLDLKKGVLSKSILERGGEVIQQDLRKYLEQHGQAELGKVVWTSGGSLDCKAVYHLSLPSWRDDHGWKMRSAVKECLDLASKKNARSIAFPTLGTGRLGYPGDEVASIMFSVIGEWFQNNPRCSLKEVQIIVFTRDSDTLEAFKAAERQGGGSHRDDSYGDDRRSSGRGGRGRGGDRHSKHGGNGHRDDRHRDSWRGGGGSSGTKIKMGRVTVMVKEGNILTEPCDAIVNSTNDNLDLSFGVLSKAISKACGPDLAADCRAQRDRMSQTGVVITKVESQSLSCGNIIHVSADRFKQNWQEGVLNILRAAEKEGIQSVSLPALGTGGRGADPTALAEAMQRAVSRFAERARSLNEVRVVVFQREMLAPYIAAFDPGAAAGGEDYSSDTSEAPKGAHSHRKNEQGIDVYIYSTKQLALKEAREKIYKHVQCVCTSHTETSPLIANFSPKQKDELFKLQKKHSVEIDLDQKKSAVTFRGVDINVAKAVSSLKDIILSATTDRHLAAGMPPVRWQYEASKDKFVDFEPDLVLHIEAAFKRKEPEVKFSDKKGRGYKIVFRDRKEYPLDRHGHPVAVKRRDILEEKKQEIPLPTHWAPMKGEKVKRVELKPDSNEYKRVSEHFGGQTAIKKIERIQNPSLFQQFKVKKKELEQYNPKDTENEKRLFHGTPSESVEAIITNGFNRSYCGKHGTALGNGVYFAAHSSVSMGYARGGHMFQARVLVGEYTPGSAGQRMPPPKPNSIRTYDSLSNAPQNATVFVIFHDSQAYPEYLISF